MRKVLTLLAIALCSLLVAAEPQPDGRPSRDLCRCLARGGGLTPAAPESLVAYAALNHTCLTYGTETKTACQDLQKLWFLSVATQHATGECKVPWGNPPNPVKWLGSGCKTCPFKKSDPRCANFHDGSGGCKLWCDCMSIKCKSSCDQNNYGCYWLQQGNLPGLCLNRPSIMGCSGWVPIAAVR